MAKTAGALRMSGMNSGFDTEAMVEAMTASTKLKMTKAQRKVLKLEASQKAYRSIISQLDTFQKKYFDVLNRNTYLKSPSLFNQFKANLSQDGKSVDNISGVTFTSTPNAQGGKYDITVEQVATQSKFETAQFGSDMKVDLSQYSNSSSEYGMTVIVGGKEKVISFNGGTESEVVDNINAALKDAYGVANDGSGMVTVNADGKISSIDKKPVSISEVSELKANGLLNLTDVKTGSNTIYIRVAGEEKAVNFKTIANNYFDDIFADDGSLKDGADASKVALYKEIMLDKYNGMVNEEYKVWKDEVKQEKTDEYNQKLANGEFETDAEGNPKVSLEQYLKSNTTIEEDQLFEDYFVIAEEQNYEKYYDRAYEKASKKAYDEAKKTDPSITDTLERWRETNYTKEGHFEASEDFTNFETDYFGDPSDPDDTGYQLDKDLYRAAKYNDFEAYKACRFPEAGNPNKPTYEEFEKEYLTDPGAKDHAGEITEHFNKNSIENSLGKLKFSDGSTASVTFNADGNFDVVVKDKDGNAVDFAMTSKKDSANDFGLGEGRTDALDLSITTKLSELGLTADDNGKFNFKINGVSFSFAQNTTVKEMMNEVNASKAGVNMSFTTLTNSFTVASKEYGAGKKVEFEDGGEGLLGKLGFNGGTHTDGKNLQLDVNGHRIETSSNSYEINGSTFTFSESVEVGTKFTAEVVADKSKAIDAIKSFVNDYNELVKNVFGMTSEKPQKDYYFLTDDDKEEMNLSDKQEEKWEIMANKGLLYNDSTVLGVMSKLRTTLYQSVQTTGGETFGLYNMGITTASAWQEHGKLQIDEAKLTAAFETNSDEIIKLFTDSKTGIMATFDKEITNAIKTTGERGEKGVLVQRAGTETGTSATDNAMYDEIVQLKKQIVTFKLRYETQQERFWKIFSNMEQQLGELNSQQSSITKMLGM